MGVTYIDGDFIYGTQGGSFGKTDIIKIAADMQKALVQDILDFKFDKKFWRNKILEQKKVVEEYKLDEEHIVKTLAISKSLDEYGKPVIDGKTGKHKLRKSDGEPMFSPIPAHIQLAIEHKKFGILYEIGDKVEYIVENSSPKIKAISLEDFRKKPNYDIDYYWMRIITPLLEILMVTHKLDVFTYFSECWNKSEKQLEREIKKLQEEDESKS